MSEFAVTKRTQVRRLPKRGVYDREQVYRILDEGIVCHVGFVSEGHPVVIATGYGRGEDALYVHGSAASRMLRDVGKGIDMCVTVTLVDGLVLARSAFHHSMNYRSVVVFGTATVIQDPAEKNEALRVITEHLVPGRWQQARQPTAKELEATMVLAVPLEEVSAKVRTGPPLDDEEDYGLPMWAGVLPLQLIPGEPIADPRLQAAATAPQNVREYRRAGRK